MQRFFWRVLLPALVLSGLALVYCGTAYQQSVALAYATHPHSPLAPLHAFVIGSDPVDGSTISTVPSVVRIFFNANISPLSIAHVYNTQNGQFVEVQTIRSFISPQNARELDTPLVSPNTLPQGGYFVRWTAVADDDGHTTYGTIGFNVGYSSTGLSGTPTLGPSSSNAVAEIRQLDFLAVMGIAWQWLSLIALIFWLGILLVERLVLSRAERAASWLNRIQKQVSQMQLLCLSIMLVGEAVTLLLRVLRLGETLTGGKIDFSTLWPLLIASNYGHLWLIRMLLILVAIWFLRYSNSIYKARSLAPLPTSNRFQAAGVRHTAPTASVTASGEALLSQREAKDDTSPSLPRVPSIRSLSAASATESTRHYTAVWLFLASVIVFTVALSNDAVQLAQAHISAVILTWLSLMAQGVWFGGLAYLGYLFLPTVKEDANAEALTDFLKHFSPWLLTAIGGVLISGLFIAESTLSTADQLLSDPYGRTILIMCILLLGILLISLYILFVLRPSLVHQSVFLAVVDADLPARRTRRSALERSERILKQVLNGQMLLAAAFLLCSVLLTFYAPPIVFPNMTYSNPASAATTIGITQSKTVNKLTITVEVLPGRVGYVNTVIVTLTDADNKPISDAQIQLVTNMITMDMGTTRVTLNGGNPTYIATFNKNTAFSMAGVWQLSLSIQRPGQAPIQTSFIITLET